MELTKVDIQVLKRHSRYENYLRKFPAVSCYSRTKNLLTKSGFSQLSRIQLSIGIEN